MTRPTTSVVYAALALVLALAGLDQTILSTALPAIAADLQGQGQLSWVFSAYLIASTVVIPIYGKLADRLGPRPLLLVASGLFIAGSLGCAISPSIDALIAARALQGLGGGGLMTLTLVSVATLFTPEQRARRQGLLGAAYGVATMIGPLIGGLLVQHLSWRWAFVLNLPLALAAWVVLARARFGQAATVRPPLDVAGAALLAAALVSLLLATRDGQAGTTTGWALLVAGALLLLTWAWVERRAADALIPFGLFRQGAFAAAAALSLCSGVALFSAVVYLPYYLQTALHLSPTQSALHLLPLMVSLTLAANACGRALRAGVSVRALGQGACLSMALSFAALSWGLGHAADSAWVFSLAVVPLGLGLGLLFPVLTVVAQRSAAPRHIGIATATPIMLRALGGALGVSALGTLLSQHIGAALGSAGMPASTRGAVTALALASERFTAALAGGLQSVYLVATGVTLLAFVIALALPRRMPALAASAAAAAA